MSFGTRKPLDHLPPSRPAAMVAADAVAALDARRQAQIQNQIDSINRLLKDGTYDGEMAALHDTAAEQRARADSGLAELRAVIGSVSNPVLLGRLREVERILEGRPQ